MNPPSNMKYPTAEEQQGLLAFQKAMDEAIDKAVNEYNLKVAQLTKEQFIDALKQAIACGDFKRHVVAGRDIGDLNHSQQVIYLPYAREQYLLNQIEELKTRITEMERDAFDARCENEEIVANIERNNETI